MVAKTFSATVRQALDNPVVAIVDLQGEINSLAEVSLNAAYAQAGNHNPYAILLDFSQVTYINSTGIALIVGLLAQARQAGRRLLAYGLNDHYVEIFKITRLVDFVSIMPDEASALASVSVPA